MCYVQIAMAAIALYAGAKQASAQKAAGKAEAKIAENNAVLADQAAKDSAILGARESQQATWRGRALMGRQLATIAANNIDSDSGTPFELLGEGQLFAGAEKSAIEMDAARKAWGFGAEATNHRNRGTLAKWGGNQQAQVTMLGALGNAVGSFAGGMGGKGGGGKSG